MEHKHKPARRKQVRWQEIHTRLTRKGWPAWLVNAKVDAFRERMRDAKREKLFAYQHRTYWAKLMRPLMYELDSARTGMRYAREHTPDNAQKIEALEAYVIVMEELAMRLTSHRDDKVQTPSQLAKAYNDEHKKRGKGFFVPGNGAHWTDWIPTHIKLRVTDLFMFAPRAPRSKPRLPFKRTMPPSLQSDAILALRKRIDNELAMVHSFLEMHPPAHLDPDPERKKWHSYKTRVEQMNRALHILDTMKRSDFVPTTWKALLVAHGEAPPFTGEEDETID
jgi:hypothetical protein